MFSTATGRGHFIYPILAASALTVVLVLGGLSALFLEAAGSMLTAQIERQTAKIGASAADGVNKWLEGRLLLVRALAETLSAEGTENVATLLARPVLNETFSPVYYGDHGGRFVRQPSVKMPDGYDPRERPWYKTTKTSGAPTLSKPYVSASTGKLVMTVAAPVSRDSQLQGVAGADLDLQSVRQFLLSFDLEAQGFVFLVDGGGTVLVHPEQDRVMKPLDERLHVDRAGLQQADGNLVAFAPVPLTGWYVGVALDEQAVFAPLRTYRLWAVGGTVSVVVLLVGVLALLMLRMVARPVGLMAHSMAALAEGDLGGQIPFAQRGDEIGAMARTLTVFRNSLIENRQLDEVREDLRRRGEVEKRAMIDKLAQGLSDSVGHVVDVVETSARGLTDAAHGMAENAEAAQTTSAAVSAAGEEASTSVSTVACATEQLTGAIGEITRQVTQSADLASMATDQAERTSVSVTALAEAAGRIGAVVEIISSIANQTNLLALNATIEAARAGEAGKGFVVVAGEVKTLANQTARATEDIRRLVQEIQSATSGTVGEIDLIGRTIDQINQVTATIAAAIHQQEAATAEISRSVRQTAEAASSVATNITGVSSSARDTRVSAGQVLASAEDLAEQAASLRGVLAHFLDDIHRA